MDCAWSNQPVPMTSDGRGDLDISTYLLTYLVHVHFNVIGLRDLTKIALSRGFNGHGMPGDAAPVVVDLLIPAVDWRRYEHSSALSIQLDRLIDQRRQPARWPQAAASRATHLAARWHHSRHAIINRAAGQRVSCN